MEKVSRLSALTDVVTRIEHDDRLDGVASSLSGVIASVVPEGNARAILRGAGLGHPAHPMLTDLPIGAWTSAWVLDLVGGQRGARAAQMLVGFGCLCAVPTALSGAADWLARDRVDQRVGVVHASANSAAFVLYSCSWLARRRHRRGTGIAFGMLGAAAATAGGYLGGRLAFGEE